MTLPSMTRFETPNPSFGRGIGEHRQGLDAADDSWFVRGVGRPSKIDRQEIMGAFMAVKVWTAFGRVVVAERTTARPVHFVPISLRESVNYENSEATIRPNPRSGPRWTTPPASRPSAAGARRLVLNVKAIQTPLSIFHQ
jgi:hypothetical protein